MISVDMTLTESYSEPAQWQEELSKIYGLGHTHL